MMFEEHCPCLRLPLKSGMSVSGDGEASGQKGPTLRLGSQIIPAARFAVRKFGARRTLVRVPREVEESTDVEKARVICNFHLLLDWRVMRKAQFTLFFFAFWSDNAMPIAGKKWFGAKRKNVICIPYFHSFRVFSFISQFSPSVCLSPPANISRVSWSIWTKFGTKCYHRNRTRNTRKIEVTYIGHRIACISYIFFARYRYLDKIEINN